jgi:hypothetical protein
VIPTSTELHRGISEMSRAMPEYAKTEAGKAVLRLLDLLEMHSLVSLAEATAGELQHKQGAHRQLAALRKTLETGALPLV